MFESIESEKAPYALPQGERALEDPPGLGRRAVLLGALSAGVFGAAAGSLLPALAGRSSTSRIQRPRLAWARDVAAGDLATLLAVRETWLSILARHGAREPELWLGWRRLADAATSAEDLADRSVLAKLLLHRLEGAPADLRAALRIEQDRLEEVAQWR